jgi:ABC-type transporter Mla MlaB component
MLYPRFSHQFEPWNELVKTMKEGEVRRVWLKRPNRKDAAVFEIELASVVRTDSAGEPIIENQ